MLRVPPSDVVQILTTRDGSKLIGRVVEVTDDMLRFETDMGVLNIPLDRVKEIKEVPAKTIKDGEYWFPDPNATRLFFAPTGRTLPQGQGYFGDYYIFFPTVAFGISNMATMGLGMSLFPGVDTQIFFFTPKLGLASGPDYAYSLGALIVKVPVEDAPLVGILYGVGTIGKPDRSVTLGDRLRIRRFRSHR
jgi:hypothetical protein